MKTQNHDHFRKAEIRKALGRELSILAIVLSVLIFIGAACGSVDSGIEAPAEEEDRLDAAAEPLASTDEERRTDKAGDYHPSKNRPTPSPTPEELGPGLPIDPDPDSPAAPRPIASTEIGPIEEPLP